MVRFLSALCFDRNEMCAFTRVVDSALCQNVMVWIYICGLR